MTPVVAYPVPDNSSWQVVRLDDDNIQLSWADVNYNGLLYYRVMVLNDNDDYVITSRKNSSNATINLPNLYNTLGSESLRWRVEVHDSSSYQTLRNRRNGDPIALTVPAITSTPLLTGRINHRSFASGSRQLRHFSDVAAFDQILALNVTGPGGYDLDLKSAGQQYTGFDYLGYSLATTEDATPGLYALPPDD